MNCVTAASCCQSVKKLCIVEGPSDIVALFPGTTCEFEVRVDQAILSAREILDKIISIPNDERTYANTVEAFDDLYLNSNIAVMRNVLDVIQRVHPEKEMREAAATLNKKIQDFYIAYLDNNVAIYQSIKGYADLRAPQESITRQERFVLEKMMSRFIRSGLHLPTNVQEKIKRIKERLNFLIQRFEKNIYDDNRTIIVTRLCLAGLSESFIKSLRQTSDGSYELSIDEPTYAQVMMNCSIEATRKKLYLAYANRGYPQNESVLQEILRLRDELAVTLGFPSYASLDLDDQMAGSPERAEKFLYELIEKANIKEADEFKRLSADLPDSVVLSSDGRLHLWNLSYVRNYYKKKNLQLDADLIAEYFPLDKALGRVLNIYQQFFGLQFTLMPLANMWDPEIKLIQIANEQQMVMGYILLDLHPRPSKYTSGCHASIIPAPRDHGGKQYPTLAIIIANLPKSTADKPALLKLSDLITFFHEFGHAMHAMLGRAFINPFSPMRIQSDFLEVPSQMFEEWLGDREILKSVSCHYLNQKPLSDELIDKIVQQKNFSAGENIQWLSCFSLFTLACYKKGPQKDPYRLLYDLRSRLCVHQKISDDAHNYASSLHLTAYAARVYSYLWAQVYSIDLFYEIKKHGLLNKETGKRFMHEVLCKGDREDPNKFVKDFLGHEVSQAPFLEQMGIM
jgi:thimet oligopeptidase